MTKTLPRYYDHDSFLELHDNRTLWEVISDSFDWDEYELIVNLAMAQFKDETGVELYLLGRSGRHVCVADTPANSRKYQYLRTKALKLEQMVIDTVNSA